MKTTPVTVARTGLVLTAALAGLVLSGAEATDLLAPAKRAEMLAHAAKVQQTKTAEGEIPNPFYPAAFGAVSAAAATAGQPAPTVGGSPAPKASLAGQALLQAIAAGLKPSGSLTVGGQPTLAFGQKRVKAGGTLTITFEGAEYILEIVSIDRTHFTLRLNREEFTRPIK